MKTRYLMLAATIIAACAAPSADATGGATDNPTAADSAQQPNPGDTEVWEPEPRIVTPGVGAAAPSDAIVLFDGSDLSAWSRADGNDAGWKVADGAMTVVAGSGDIQTRQPFGSVQLHLEWRAPATVSGDGQGRGNSGVYLMSKYELQVLDSYDNRTYANGQAGSIYKQYAPLVNASRPPGQWQTYDVIFDAPRFAADSTLVRPAYMSVLQNGVLIQDHVELKGPTLYIGTPAWQVHAPELPLLLQDHGNPVSYRNIWIRKLDGATG